MSTPLRSEHRQAQVALFNILCPFGKALPDEQDTDSPSPPDPDITNDCSTRDSGPEPVSPEDVQVPPADTTPTQTLSEGQPHTQLSAPRPPTPSRPNITDRTKPDTQPSTPSSTATQGTAAPVTANDTPPKPTYGDTQRASDRHTENADSELSPIAVLAFERTTEALLAPTPRLAYAVQVTRLAAQLSIITELPPLPFLEAPLFADRLSVPDGPMAAHLTEVLTRFPPPDTFSDHDASRRDVYIMLALAGTLRPTLMSPQSGAWTLLSALKPSDRLRALYRFAHSVADASLKLQQGVRLDVTVLKAASSDAAWTAEREKLVSEIADWQERAAQATIIYAPATKVWQHWFGPSGFISSLLDLLSSSTENDTLISDRIRRLTNRRDFKLLVKETDGLHAGRPKRDDIHSRALDQLYDRAQRAADFAKRHLSLNASRPSHSTFLTQAIANLRHQISELAPPALDELRTLASCDTSLMSASANVAAYSVTRFSDVLDDGIDDEPNPFDLLASELFHFPSITIDSGYTHGEPMTALNTLLTDEPEPAESSIHRRLQLGDYQTVRRIVAWLESEGTDDTAGFRQSLDDALRAENRDLRNDMSDTRTKVEVALSRGHLSETERATHDARLVEMERRVLGSAPIDFQRERATLNEIVNDTSIGLDLQRRTTGTLLEKLTIAPDSREYIAISHSIERADLITANELIDRVRREQSLPDAQPLAQKTTVFQDFYPGRADAIDTALTDARNPSRIIEHLTADDHFGGMALRNIPGAQRDSAKRMLTAWFDLKRAARLGAGALDQVSILFTGMGFIVREFTITRHDPGVAFGVLQTAPLRARERCPIPAFGSNVDGNYRLVFLWGRPTEEDILQHADDSNRKRATLLLYFGRLTKARRDGLAKLARQRSRTLLLLDELLLVFLCGQRDSRLPVFFACATPFTYVQPYVTTAGLVPPEMFYGREQEMREIADPIGSCFIYGGRQLGKTALLRAVERTTHRPHEGSFALWIDLKGEGIGYDRGVAHIWSSIWRALRKLSVLPDHMKEPNPNVRGAIDKFSDFLVTYFDRSSGRFLLLLLDEADRFLEVDARDDTPGVSATGFRESSRLKALMDQTERSIKVVFAGLHNVLRTVESSNHPLGHFGQAIQVGPLWRTAEALVRDPLLASGYQFSSENLVTRVLAQTNYYPNLIQLYGSELVKAMCSRRVSSGPLYEIDEAVVEDTYLTNTNLREIIRSRFHMTLQLDPRYEIIAYSIAYMCNEHSNVLRDGLEFRVIDEVSRGYWPQGFEDIEPCADRFRSLLDEMTGLGVLRAVGDDHYTLRNPNILMLMGTPDEIETNLLRDRQVSQAFERELYRAHDPRHSEGPARSPLTYQQEDVLRAKSGVSVVCGIEASGYGDVLNFLEAREGESVSKLIGSTNHREFEDELKRRLRRRAKESEGTAIYAVPDSVPWSETWVGVALDSIRKLRRTDKVVRVVFFADPTHLLQLLSSLEELNRTGLEWTSLRPWREGFLRQWIEDVGFGNAPETREAVSDQTGGWPLLLTMLYDLEQRRGNLYTSLEILDKELRSYCRLEELLVAFGLGDLEIQKTLLIYLTQLGNADVTELQAFAEDEGIGADIVRVSLKWGELLHLVRRVGRERWTVDPIVTRLLDRDNS